MRKLNNYYLDKAIEFNQFIETRRSKFEPFQITINFLCGRLGNSYLFFDSVIAHYTYEYVLKDAFYNISPHFDERLHIDVPIAKKFFYDENNEKEYFYLISCIKKLPHIVTFITKRTEQPVVPIIKEKRVRVNAGVLKNQKIAYQYDNQKTIVVKGIGDIELIDKILPKCLRIGKKVSIGFGEAYYTRIESIPKLELFDNETQHYIRPLPITYVRQKHLPVFNIVESIYRPPYYGLDVKYAECCF